MQPIDYGTYNPFAAASSSSSLAPPPITPPAPPVVAVRGRDQPFPPPRGREYPVLPAPAPVPVQTRTQTQTQTAAQDPPGSRRRRRRPDTYFDETLGEWRSIPASDAEQDPSRPQQHEEKQEEEEQEEEEEEVPGRKRDALKKLGRGLVLAVKNLGGSPERKERDDEERRAKILASISAPMGTARSGRRR